MNKIDFENGSVIKGVETKCKSIRGKKREIGLDMIDTFFDNMTDTEITKIFEEASEAYDKSWLPKNQNSFYSCQYCGKDGHIILCNDLIGRSFCPACKSKAEKEFLNNYLEDK